MSRKPIICLDFDGVLHSYSSGWKGASVIPDPPTPGAMEWLREIYEGARFDVSIYSSRSSSVPGRLAMKRWLAASLSDEFGNMIGPNWDPIRLEIAEWVKWPWFKPPALITIDDRALTFSGNWRDYDADDLLNFKPWNKRPAAA